MKKNLISTFLFINLIAIIPLNVFSQNSAKTVTSQNAEWKLYNEVNNIQIFVKNCDCHDNANGIHQELILLKFINKSSQRKEISWSEKLYYNGNCVNCDEKNSELSFEIELLPNQEKLGNCNDNYETFKIFSKFLNYKDKPYLTKYELNNIVVK